MQKKENCVGQEWKYKVITFTIVFAVCLVVQFVLGEKEFTYGDSWDYWERGESLWREGHFSLNNQRDGFRGYVFPLFLGICNQLGGVTCFRIVNALIIAFLFSVLLPELFEVERYGKRNACATLLFYGLLTVFFWGVQTYALSDLFAFFVCILAIYFVKKLVVATTKIRIAIFSILIGVLMYVMYNVRTIYMFAAACIVGYIFWYFIRKKKIIENSICFASGILGIGIGGLPQMIMNWGYLNKVSLSVPTNNLMLKQLDWGLRYQRYDTYIGTQQSIPQMYFVDAVGMNILQKEGLLETEIERWSQYIKIVIKYPLEVVGIYTRHLLNMLFPAWPNQYVLDLDSGKVILLLIAFNCLFFVGISCILGRINNKNLKNFLPVLLPVVAITPGAVESRFFMPLYVIILGKICFDIDWIALFGDIKEYRYKILGSYCIAFCILVSVWSSMLASESAYPIFF